MVAAQGQLKWHERLSHREVLIRLVEESASTRQSFIELSGAIVAAIDNLAQAVNDQTASVNAAVAKLDEASPDAAIQAAADQISANNATLDAAVNPPVVAAADGQPTNPAVQ